MSKPATSLTLSVTIQRDASDVYQLIIDPTKLPLWAGGLGQTVQKLGDDWIVQTAAGPMKIVFAGKNDFGVADHTVYPPHAAPVHVPMRVLKNGSGSEVLFTLFRQPDMSDAQYERDAEMVRQDLRKLQQVLEQVREQAPQQ